MSANSKWTESDVPSQNGRVAIITGANTGLGFETARVLANRGAHVVMAVRDIDKGAAAAARITDASPDADVSVQELDLSSLESVRNAAEQIRTAHPTIDLLINNAGVMFPPERSVTKDGFELQFGTNHLGHYALTGLLLDSILPLDDSRVVTVSSMAHRRGGELNFADLQNEHEYDKTVAYGQSKLANLLFTYELQRRLSASGAKTIAVGAHPGISSTDLMRHISTSRLPGVMALMGALTNKPRIGALPTLRAATDPNTIGGQYLGPNGFRELRGHPVVVQSNPESHDEKTQARLWEVSAELTGVTFSV